MLCQSCGKNEASIHVTRVADGHTQESHLCLACAAAANVGLSDLFAGLIGEESNKGQVCPKCGISLKEVQKSGRLGCPECYTHFQTALAPLLGRVQGGAGHKGRTPAASPEAQREKTLKELREQMNAAVSQEDFEQAAVLRDKIRALEKEAEQA